MPNLNFDPLFDPSLPDDDHKEREAPRINDKHESNVFLEKNEESSESRNRMLNAINRLINVAGSLLCVASALFVIYYCVIYMGVFTI
jgi:hypothetical protein